MANSCCNEEGGTLSVPHCNGEACLLFAVLTVEVDESIEEDDDDDDEEVAFDEEYGIDDDD